VTSSRFFCPNFYEFNSLSGLLKLPVVSVRLTHDRKHDTRDNSASNHVNIRPESANANLLPRLITRRRNTSMVNKLWAFGETSGCKENRLKINTGRRTGREREKRKRKGESHVALTAAANHLARRPFRSRLLSSAVREGKTFIDFHDDHGHNVRNRETREIRANFRIKNENTTAQAESFTKFFLLSLSVRAHQGKVSWNYQPGRSTFLYMQTLRNILDRWTASNRTTMAGTITNFCEYAGLALVVSGFWLARSQ
jgi:hypothetical protein